MSFTVTATQGGNRASGMAMVLKVVTGTAASQPGATTGALTGTPSIPITPAGTGSWVYGAILADSGTWTADAAATFEQNVSSGGLEYIQLRSTSTTTSGTPVTLGGTSSATGLSIALCEILAAGTLAEDASSPAVSAYHSSQSVTTAAFNPPGSAVLVAMISSNGTAGTTTMAVTDSSNLGLTWVEQMKENGSSKGYAGVWTAQLPAGPIVTAATATGTGTAKSTTPVLAGVASGSGAAILPVFPGDVFPPAAAATAAALASSPVQGGALAAAAGAAGSVAPPAVTPFLYRLWPSTTGGVLFNNVGTSDLGVEFYVIEPASLAGYWWWCPPGGIQIVNQLSFRLYSVITGTTGTLVDETTVSTATPLTLNAWNWIPLGSLVALSVGSASVNHYRASVTYGGGGQKHYASTISYWTTGAGAAGVTTGPLTAPNAAGAIGGIQGSYNEPTTGSMPASENLNANYWLDVQISSTSAFCVAGLPAAAGAVPFAAGESSAPAAHLAAATATASPVTLKPPESGYSGILVPILRPLDYSSDVSAISEDSPGTATAPFAAGALTYLNLIGLNPVLAAGAALNAAVAVAANGTAQTAAAAAAGLPASSDHPDALAGAGSGVAAAAAAAVTVTANGSPQTAAGTGAAGPASAGTPGAATPPAAVAAGAAGNAAITASGSPAAAAAAGIAAVPAPRAAPSAMPAPAAGPAAAEPATISASGNPGAPAQLAAGTGMANPANAGIPGAAIPAVAAAAAEAAVAGSVTGAAAGLPAAAGVAAGVAAVTSPHVPALLAEGAGQAQAIAWPPPPGMQTYAAQVPSDAGLQISLSAPLAQGFAPTGSAIGLLVQNSGVLSVTVTLPVPVTYDGLVIEARQVTVPGGALYLIPLPSSVYGQRDMPVTYTTATGVAAGVIGIP